jgi:hypothetical protein
MRRAVLAAAAATLLTGPTLLAFFSGGYFLEPRLLATALGWTVVVVCALAAPRCLPRGLPGWLALCGLGLLTAWSAASIGWAPVSTPALHNVQRLLLFEGVLIAAVALLRGPRTLAAVEPALAAGTVIVIGYGLAGRLLPGLIDLDHSSGAGGRLEQPLTYWNAEGLLAGMGLVLCARIAGDGSRPPRLRALAGAASPLLGMGVYLSFSRGAIAASLVGLVILVAAAPTWAQLRATGLALAGAALAGGASALFGAVSSLSGATSAREGQGAALLAILVALMVGAAAATTLLARREREGRGRWGRLPAARRLPAVAAATVLVAAAIVVIGGLNERANTTTAGPNAGVSRLASVNSSRYEYWRLGLRAFAAHPLDGLGSGGFRYYWLRERRIREGVAEVHSLELGVAAELGIPGVIALGLLLTGVGLAACRALRRHPELAAGSCAVLVVWLMHASIDWDWELPAVTLPALVLAGAMIALAERPAPGAAADADALPGGEWLDPARPARSTSPAEAKVSAP